MKLKNKISGEIKEFVIFDGNEMQAGLTLKDLAQEWEDVLEQKEYWSINELGTLIQITHTRENIYDKSRKNFGNYFSSREEAEKAVEKLRAYKRLKDKGFEFRDWDTSHHNLGVIDFFLPDVVNDFDEYRKDLDLLFQGDEE